ncbi:MAG: prephenate dehydrogenase [Candidatus Omnitrophota bacterium]
MFKKIAIVGVGLIGGSIGLAVRKNRLAKEVVGIGRRKSSIEKAIQAKAINKGTLDFRKGVSDADLVIIAAPVDKVMLKIKEAAVYGKKGVVVIDVNSAKESVVDYADSIMPKDKYFVGTHPLAGLEESGISFAVEGLFNDTVSVITPTKHTNKKAAARVKSFWKSLGAEIKVFSPKEHDKVVANISHLPHILAYSLCNAVSSSDLRIAGSGFKDMTRIAKSDPYMWLNIFLQNSENVLNSIRVFESNLSSLKSYIRSKKKGPLFRRLYAAQQKRNKVE